MTGTVESSERGLTLAHDYDTRHTRIFLKDGWYIEINKQMRLLEKLSMMVLLSVMTTL